MEDARQLTMTWQPLPNVSERERETNLLLPTGKNFGYMIL
jgi:hypothetical protein